MPASQSVPGELLEHCSKAGIKVAVRREGLILEEFELPVRSNARTTSSRVFTELLEYADAQGLPVAATPEKVGKGAGEQALERWYQGFGFRPNNGTHPEFLQTYVRDATQAREQQVSELTAAGEPESRTQRPVAERETTFAAAADLQRDPLEQYRDRFGERGVTWIGRRAVELGPRVATQSPEWLRQRVGEADQALARAPSMRDLARGWIRAGGERAARALAIEGELARRRSAASDGQARASGDAARESASRPPGADRWARLPYRYRELLDERQVAWFDQRAGTLRGALEARPDEFLQEQRAAIGTVDQAFEPLDHHAGEIAARDVAVRRELISREEMAAFRDTERSAAVSAPRLAATGEDMGELTRKSRQYLGDERAAALLKHARALEHGMQELDPETLEPLGAWLGEPFEALDVENALAVRRAEAGERIRRAQSRQELAMAEGEYAKASTLAGRRTRDAQREHVQAAKAHRETAEKLTASVDDLRLAQRQIREQGLHPDQWIAAHGDRAARTIAVRATLERERQREQELGGGREPGQEVEVQAEMQPPAVEQRGARGRNGRPRPVGRLTDDGARLALEPRRRAPSEQRHRRR